MDISNVTVEMIDRVCATREQTLKNEFITSIDMDMNSINNVKPEIRFKLMGLLLSSINTDIMRHN